MPPQDLYSQVGPTQFMDPTQFAGARPQEVPGNYGPNQPMPQAPGGPTYGDERARIAQEAINVDRAPTKIKKTEEVKSDGKRIDTVSNDGGTYTKTTDGDGQVSSVKITTYDAVNDPIQPAARYQSPQRNWGNMDWTPVRKLTDDIYGTNIAAGSRDPLDAETARAARAYQLNQGAERIDRQDAREVSRRQELRAKLGYQSARDTIGDDLRERKFEANTKYLEALARKAGDKKSGGGWAEPGTVRRVAQDLKKAQLEKALRPTLYMQKARGLADTGEQAETDYQKAITKGRVKRSYNPTDTSSPIDTYAQMPEMGRFLQSDAAVEAHSSSGRWLNSFLRDESGAALPDEEIPRFRRMYFPGPGDTKESVASKKRARQVKMNSARRTSGMKDEELKQYYKQQAKENDNQLEVYETSLRGVSDIRVSPERIEIDKKIKALDDEEAKLKKELGL